MEDFHKYNKIFAIGHKENEDIFLDPEDKIVVDEKVDGGNFRFMIKDGIVIFGSRTQQLTSDDGEESNMAKQFKRCADFVRHQIDKNKHNVQEGLIYYGECMTSHTMNYDWDRVPPFLGFDVYSIKDKIFLENREQIFEGLGLPMVPIVMKIIVRDAIDINDDLVPISKYALESAEDKKAEGVVFKNYKKQIFAKYVRDVFREKNSEVFGGTPKYNKIDDTNNADFVFKYCTNNRIEKLIFKEIDNGKKLGMELMGDLIRNTYLDIIEEEWREIMTSNWKLDFKNIRKLIAKRVVAVLKQMIDNQRIMN